jgi:hypothetical protein
MIPEIAAKEVVECGGVPKWFSDRPGAKSGVPTPEALALLKTLFTTIPSPLKPVLEKQENAIVVVLPDDFRVIARQDNIGVIQPRTDIAMHYKHSAMNSAFFPMLVYQLLGESGAPALTADKIRVALEYGYRQNKADREWIESKGDQAKLPPTLSAFVKAQNHLSNQFRSSDICDLDFQKQLDEWDGAHKPPCIVKTAKYGKPEECIELWRSMIEVDGFVCCTKDKRNVIARMVRDLTPYAKTRPQHNESGMVLANPGSGKSTLIKRLATSLNMEPLEYNISQMLSRNELISAFDEIMTTQARDFRRLVLVFFDEINARIQDQYVFDLFLAPLQDNVFLRDGRKYPIGPCIWLFAGTQSPSKCQGAEDPSRKAVDFESRWTLGTYDLTLENNTENRTDPNTSIGKKAENIYRTISMIRRARPDVWQIARSFIEFLANLPDGVTPRQLEHIAYRLVDVRHGEITLRNLSDEAKESWGGGTSNNQADPDWVQVR